MRRTTRAALLLAVLAAAALVTPPPAVLAAPGCVDGTLPSGALSRVCVPANWNGDLVILAPYYVSPTEPLALPSVEIAPGVTPESLVQSLGYAYATTSYRRNGLVVLDGMQDLRQLIASFPAVAGQGPRRTYMVGVSEGALTATLMAERDAAGISGVLAMCGPIGDFRRQIDYIGDARVLFDYYFGVAIPIASSPIDIDPAEQAAWPATQAEIAAALLADTNRALRLLFAGQIPFDAATPQTGGESVITALWYNVFATNDAKIVLGGNPYENVGRVYSSAFGDDAALNAGVARFTADPAALAALAAYQTSGRPAVPVVTLHTRSDPAVPQWQQSLYTDRSRELGPGLAVTAITTAGYGHCRFSQADVTGALELLVARAAGWTRLALPVVWGPETSP